MAGENNRAGLSTGQAYLCENCVASSTFYSRYESNRFLKKWKTATLNIYLAQREYTCRLTTPLHVCVLYMNRWIVFICEWMMSLNMAIFFSRGDGYNGQKAIFETARHISIQGDHLTTNDMRGAADQWRVGRNRVQLYMSCVLYACTCQVFNSKLEMLPSEWDDPFSDTAKTGSPR